MKGSKDGYYGNPMPLIQGDGGIHVCLHRVGGKTEGVGYKTEAFGQ